MIDKKKILFNIWYFLSSLFGLGLVKFFPGTLGSFVSLFFWLIIYNKFTLFFIWFIIIFFFYLEL